MRELPKMAQIFITAVFILALSLLGYFTPKVDFNNYIIQGLVFFSILAVFTEILQVKLPRGGFITVTFAVTYTSLLLFGAAIAAYVTILGTVLSEAVARNKTPWYKMVFNSGQFTICVSVAQFLYVATGGTIGKIDPFNFLPLAASTAGYFVVNHLALSIILSIIQGVSPWRLWLTNLRWTLPNLFTLSLLGILMAGIYNYAGFWGVSLFFVPLLLARFIFKSYMEMRENYANTLEALASALDAKDPYTRGHSDRVATYAVELARQFKLPEDQVEAIQHTAILHDIGKIGVSDELLNRIGRLSNDEFDLIKLHPVIGANILKDFAYLGAFTAFVRSHHEKYDGSGYPDMLKAEEIPLGARIITLADSFDAMTSDRSYRNKMSLEEALEEVKRCSGTHFDPRLAEVFISCWEKKLSRAHPNAFLEVAPAADK